MKVKIMVITGLDEALNTLNIITNNNDDDNNNSLHRYR